jgi:hypothetical protein
MTKFQINFKFRNGQIPNKSQIPNINDQNFCNKTGDLTVNNIEVETKKHIFDYKLLVCYNYTMTL